MSASSKRLRLRVTEEDKARLDDLVSETPHRTRSAVTRAAIRLTRHLVALERQGLRLYRVSADGTEREHFPVLDGAMTVSSPAKGRLDAGFLELRLGQADWDDLAAMGTVIPHMTHSAQIRAALNLYADMVEAIRSGHRFRAESLDGSGIEVDVPGTAPLDSIRMNPEASSPAPRLGMLQGLPRSLAEAVEELAQREQCTVETLVIDMIRAEVAARQNGAAQAAAHEEASGLFGWETPIQAPYGEDQDGRRARPDSGDEAHQALVPRSDHTKWALVLAQDEAGAPDQLVVHPDMEIPLEPGDLALPAPDPSTDE